MAPSSECDAYVLPSATFQQYKDIIVHHYKWPDPIIFPILTIGQKLNRVCTKEDRWIQLTQRCR